MMLSFYTSSTVLAVITLILSSQWSATKAQGAGGAAARRDKLKASVIFPTGLIGESADGSGAGGGGPGSGIRTTIKKRKRRKLSTTREIPKGSNTDTTDATDAAEIDDKAERRRQRKEQRRNRRALNGKGGRGDCGECPTDTYYYFKALGANNFFYDAFTKEPTGCVLAAIRDHESRRAAQYAIPDGLIAITQGYFPIDDYIGSCAFQDPKTDDGQVEFCDDSYNNYFENYEGTDVPSDSECWFDTVNLSERDIPDGAIHAAIGSDGLLRPVQDWNRDTENSEFAWDGAIYECCPFDLEICEILPEESEDTV